MYSRRRGRLKPKSRAKSSKKTMAAALAKAPRGGRSGASLLPAICRRKLHEAVTGRSVPGMPFARRGSQQPNLISVLNINNLHRFTSKRSYHGDPYDGIGTLPFQFFGIVMAISGALMIRPMYLSLRDEQQEQHMKEELVQRMKKEQEQRMHINKALGRSE
ncbi:hypothetical protein ACP70R_032344 [Stipagrostis hirtigluma subsp. patula]